MFEGLAELVTLAASRLSFSVRLAWVIWITLLGLAIIVMVIRLQLDRRSGTLKYLSRRAKERAEALAAGGTVSDFQVRLLILREVARNAPFIKSLIIAFVLILGWSIWDVTQHRFQLDTVI